METAPWSTLQHEGREDKSGKIPSRNNQKDEGWERVIAGKTREMGHLRKKPWSR